MGGALLGLKNDEEIDFLLNSAGTCQLLLLLLYASEAQTPFLEEIE